MTTTANEIKNALTAAAVDAVLTVAENAAHIKRWHYQRTRPDMPGAAYVNLREGYRLLVLVETHYSYRLLYDRGATDVKRETALELITAALSDGAIDA